MKEHLYYVNQLLDLSPENQFSSSDLHIYWKAFLLI
jgi:hypothetical protein